MTWLLGPLLSVFYKSTPIDMLAEYSPISGPVAYFSVGYPPQEVRLVLNFNTRVTLFFNECPPFVDCFDLGRSITFAHFSRARASGNIVGGESIKLPDQSNYERFQVIIGSLSLSSGFVRIKGHDTAGSAGVGIGSPLFKDRVIQIKEDVPGGPTVRFKELVDPAAAGIEPIAWLNRAREERLHSWGFRAQFGFSLSRHAFMFDLAVHGIVVPRAIVRDFINFPFRIDDTGHVLLLCNVGRTMKLSPFLEKGLIGDPIELLVMEDNSRGNDSPFCRSQIVVSEDVEYPTIGRSLLAAIDSIVVDYKHVRMGLIYNTGPRRQLPPLLSRSLTVPLVSGPFSIRGPSIVFERTDAPVDSSSLLLLRREPSEAGLLDDRGLRLMCFVFERFVSDHRFGRPDSVQLPDTFLSLRLEIDQNEVRFVREGEGTATVHIIDHKEYRMVCYPKQVEYEGVGFPDPVELEENHRLTADGNECPICLHQYNMADSVQKLPTCVHEFHDHCIDSWINRIKNHCPVCRETFTIQPKPVVS